jgi:hypothetical protein
MVRPFTLSVLILAALAAGCSRTQSDTPAAVATPTAPSANVVVPDIPEATPPTAEALPDLRLVGVSALASGTRVLILNETTGTQAWITTGSTENGIEVVSYNSTLDEATVRVNGQAMTLCLRASRTGIEAAETPLGTEAPSAWETTQAAAVATGSGPQAWSTLVQQEHTPISWTEAEERARAAQSQSASNGSGGGLTPAQELFRAVALAEPTTTATTTSGALPPAEAPLSPEEREIAEREARMLVSDLLEISQIQRQAYEEKKAAEDRAKGLRP